MAEIYARGLFDVSSGTQNSVPSPTGMLDGSPLPAPGDNGSEVRDSQLGRVSNAMAGRVFYTAAPANQFPAAFDNTDGAGYSFASFNDAVDNFPSDCWRLNAMGYAQALFFDVIPAYSIIDPEDNSGGSDILGDINASAPIVFYWHGGGFDVGYANNRDGLTDVAMQFLRMGFHVIIPEYRRGWCPIAKNSDDKLDQIGVSGWMNTDLETGISGSDQAPSGGPSVVNGYNTGLGFPPKPNEFFEATSKGISSLAIIDSMDACSWVLNNIESILPNANKRFIMWGNSAGGSISCQLGFCPGNATQVAANPVLLAQWKLINRKIIAAAPNFGTCGNDFVYGSDLTDWDHQPICVYNFQGVDQLSPIRDAHIFWQDKMFIARGTFDLWKALDLKGYNVIGFCDIVGGHGYGNLQIPKAVPGSETSSYNRLEHIDYMVSFIKLCRAGTQPPNHLVFKLFEEDDQGKVYRSMSQALGYPFSRYFITLGAADAAKMYSANGGKSGVDPSLYTVQFAAFGDLTLRFYGPQNGSVEGWSSYWFGDSITPRPSTYYDITTDIGVYSEEGRAEVIVDDAYPNGNINLFNLQYYSNYDTRDSPAP